MTNHRILCYLMKFAAFSVSDDKLFPRQVSVSRTYRFLAQSVHTTQNKNDRYGQQRYNGRGGKLMASLFSAHRNCLGSNSDRCVCVMEGRVPSSIVHSHMQYMAPSVNAPLVAA